MNWYVIRVITSKEKKIMELLKKELEICNFVDKVSKLLIPSKKVIQMRKGKKYTINKNDFPGYILIETEHVSELESTIKGVNGVIDFLGYKNPEPLKQREIDRIIGRQKDNIIEDTYFIGEIINIIDGAFNSFVGEITFVDNKKKIVKVGVKIFGREVPVNLTYLQINKT